MKQKAVPVQPPEPTATIPAPEPVYPDYVWPAPSAPK
jgi:hypothetical protein